MKNEQATQKIIDSLGACLAMLKRRHQPILHVCAKVLLFGRPPQMSSGFFCPIKGQTKNWIIRNSKCSPRKHGESWRKHFLMFMLQMAAEALFANGLREIHPGLVKPNVWSRKQNDRNLRKMGSRKLAKTYVVNFSREIYVAHGESVAKAPT